MLAADGSMSCGTVDKSATMNFLSNSTKPVFRKLWNKIRNSDGLVSNASTGRERVTQGGWVVNECVQGGRGFLMPPPLPPVWNIRAFSLIPLFYTSSFSFFCLVLLLFLSYPFLLRAHSPDFFSPKPPFSER